MATIQYVVSAQDAASATFERIAGSADNVLHKLDEIGHKTAKARVELDGDKEAGLTIDKLDLKMAKFADRVAKGRLGVDGGAAAMLEIRKLELEMDKLDAKRAKIHIDTSALSKLSAFQPSAIGTAVALSPALIPLAGQIAGAVGAISISFGAATFAAAGFGLMAGTVLKGASTDLGKLQTLNLNLAKASTAAQKQAIEQQIAQLKAGWSKGYLDLINNYQTFQQKWKSVSQSVTVPALNAWIPALTKGLQLLKPLLQPVADLFKNWGQSLDKYFSNPVTVLHLKDIAATLGNFAAIQIGQIAKFVTDLAKGFYNLARDLPPGTQLGAAGTALAGIGDAFLNWSKSKQARDDVHGFFKFLHDNGPVVTGILGDLKTILPGIFKGATGVGILELKALGDFLSLVANLPKGWQQPLTEFAGAMLLLSKIGVVKVGLKLTGLAGAIPGFAGAGAAGGPLAAAGAAIAAGLVLKIREDLKAGIVGIGKDLPKWFSGIGGIVGLSAQGWADAIVNHFEKPVKASEAAFGRWLTASAQATWGAVLSSARAFAHTMGASLAALRHDIATIWAAIRSAAASAWDTIWNNTVARVRSGISTVMRWIGTLPGQIRNAFHGALTWLAQAGRQVIQGLWNGLLFVWNKVKSFISGIASWIKAHKGPLALDAKLLEPAGRALMSGLHLGLSLGSKGPLGFISGLTGTIGSLLSKGVSAIFGGGPAGSAGSGVQRWRGLVLRALAMEHLPASLVGDVLYQMQTESGGNPNIVNTWDSNAQAGMPSTGLMQVIWPTFAAYHWPGTSWSLTDPLANIAAALNYGAHNGRGFGSGPGQIGSGHGYASGGIISEPIWGIGASGRHYSFGERGPEIVIPGGGGSMSTARVEALLAQILRAVQIAPSATSAGTARALNSAARAAVR